MNGSVSFSISETLPRAFTAPVPEARDLAEWVAENRELLGLECEKKKTEELEEFGFRGRKCPEKELSKKDWQGLLKTLEDRYSTLSSCEGAREDIRAKRLRQLGRAMDFAPEDVAILEILMWSSTQPVFESLIESVFESSSLYFRRRFFNVTTPLLPRILGLSAGTFRARLATDAPLMKSGLVSVDDDGDIEVVKRLKRLATFTDCRARRAPHAARYGDPGGAGVGRLRPCRGAARPYRKGAEGCPEFPRQRGQHPGLRTAGHR